MDVAAIQRALLARGYDLGKGGPAGDGVDSALGRLTIAAVTAFQKAEKLDILYPGTIGPKTIAALKIETTGPVAPAWIAEARRYLGLHERKDAARLDKVLRLDASEIPWCGAFVGMVMAATLPREVLPVNPLGARNWLKFGSEVKEPQVGAVAVFWRGTKGGWSGHVGFVVGHDKTHLHILGGNQSDSVSVARIAKDRLLGYRWPKTAPDVPTGKLALSTINASVTTNEA